MQTPDSSSPSYEIEAKFRVSSMGEMDSLLDVFSTLSAKLERERSYQTTIRYFDTPDLDILNAGGVLRSMDACPPLFESEVCVKTLGTLENGILKREEYELPGQEDGKVPDIEKITHPRAREIVKSAVGKKLSEVFNTVSKRRDTIRLFEINGKKVAVDLAVDDVSFVEAASGKPFYQAFEVEVEFKQSYSDKGITPAEVDFVIQQVLKSLTKDAKVEPVGESRAEAGFRMIAEKNGKNPPAFKA